MAIRTTDIVRIGLVSADQGIVRRITIPSIFSRFSTIQASILKYTMVQRVTIKVVAQGFCSTQLSAGFQRNVYSWRVD